MMTQSSVPTMHEATPFKDSKPTGTPRSSASGEAAYIPRTPHTPKSNAGAGPSATPTYLWIGCADSRLVPNQITGLPAGDIFIHRNVGNVVKASDPNCMSTLEYAINCLKVKHIIVCGHYGCGAVQAAMKMQAPLLGLLNFWITDIREAMATHSDELKGLSTSRQLSRLCELNVIRQAFNVCTSPVVQAAWTQGQYLHIHAMIFDTKTGLLTRLAGPIASPVTDGMSERSATESTAETLLAPSESGSSLASASILMSHSANRRSNKRSPVTIPKSVLAACKDKSELQTLHAMTRYLEACGCVPDVENLLGLGAKMGGGLEELSIASKGLKELEDKYTKILAELEELKAAKCMAEDAQEHLTQQAQCLMKEKSQLVQRMAQREQLINNLQERLDYVQAECQQLKGGTPEALLEELRQLATTDPSTLTPELLADMRILTSLASGELAREVASHVPHAHSLSGTSMDGSSAPCCNHSGIPLGPDSIPAGKSLFARFLEDDMAVRAAAAAVLSRPEPPAPPVLPAPSAPMGAAAGLPGAQGLPPRAASECCTQSVVGSTGLGEYHYLTMDDADRPSMRCPWTPSSSAGQSALSESHGPAAAAAARAGSVAGTSHMLEPAAAAAAGVVGTADLPAALPALKLPPPGAISPMSTSSAHPAAAAALLPPRPSSASVSEIQAAMPLAPSLSLDPAADPAATDAVDTAGRLEPAAGSGLLTQRSLARSSLDPSSCATPDGRSTEVGFADEPWVRAGAKQLKPRPPSRNLLVNACGLLMSGLNHCGVEHWRPFLAQHARPATVVLLGLLWFGLPGLTRRRGTGRKVQGARGKQPAVIEPAKEAVTEEQLQGAWEEAKLPAGAAKQVPLPAPAAVDTAPVSHPVSLPPSLGTTPAAPATPAPISLDSPPTPAAQPPAPKPQEAAVPLGPTPAAAAAAAAQDGSPAPMLGSWAAGLPAALHASAIDLVEQLEKKLEARLALKGTAAAEGAAAEGVAAEAAAAALSAAAPGPPREADLPGMDAWLLQNGWDTRWGCCEGEEQQGGYCVLRSARG